MRRLSIMRLGRLLRANVRAQLAPADGAERGAVTVIVAVLLGFGVILGCAALTVDVGSLLWERRQLQNGSDAVSMAIAQTCGKTGVCAPDISPASALSSLAGANAADNKTAIESVCGSAAAQAKYPALTLCPTPSGTPALVDCPALPPALQPAVLPTLKYVEVRTETLTASGSTILPSFFARALTGSTGETVRSCSRAAWGHPTHMNVLPITMSYCAWQNATGEQDAPTPVPPTYQPAPTGTWPGYGGGGQPAWPSPEVEIVTADSNPAPSSCTTWNGHTAPGGFSALTQSPAGSCSATTAVDGWIWGSTGNNDPCPPATMSGFRGTLAYIPIFDCVNSTPVNPPPAGDLCDGGGGSNTYYHIAGYAAFYVSGWHFSGDAQPSIKDGHTVCPGSGRCLSGWFTTGLTSQGDIGPDTGPDFGTTVVKVAG